MKKYFKLFFVFAAFAAVFTACVQEEGFDDPNAPVTISVGIPKDGLVKVALQQDANPDGAVKLKWETTDFITVKNADNEAQYVEFTYKSGAGTTEGQFTSVGGVGALSGATSFNVYLVSNLPEGYDNQIQESNGSTTHLGYSAKLVGVDAYDGAVFSQSWAGSHGGSFTSSSVLRLRAQLPNADMADEVRKVVIKSSAPIFDDGSELNITIANPGVDGNSSVVTVYATLPPGNLEIAENTELLFQFLVSETDEHDKYTAYRKLPATTFYGGQVNAFKILCPDIQSFAGPDDDGTEAHPYLIGDRHQMDAARNFLSTSTRTYFRMVDDVDLAAFSCWAPLSYQEFRQIDFEGNGHTVYNLSSNSNAEVSSTVYTHPSFIGKLYGEVRNVTFENATITCGTAKDACGGVVAGYIGSSGNQGDCTGIIIRNSTLTSGTYVGGIGARIGKGGDFSNCHIVNTTITGADCVGGFLAYTASNAAITMVDCSAERITISGGSSNENNSGVGGFIGVITGDNGVTIRRGHSTGTMAYKSGVNNLGGLVGQVRGTGVQIVNCYSTCDIGGYKYAGGLVGKFENTSQAIVEHCFASGNVSSRYGYGGFGGLVGAVKGSDVQIRNCIAWNGLVKQRLSTDYSSGAVVGFTHPNCVLTDNYRKPGMQFENLYWAPSENFDHPNVNGTTAPLVRIGTDLDESKAAPTTLTTLDESNAEKTRFAYHGKHLPAGAEVTPNDALGWTSADIAGNDDPDTDPEDPSWTDVPSFTQGTTETIRPGVEYTHFHDTWQGDVRDIHIIRTTLDEHNSLDIYYNYTQDGLRYLNEKCKYLNALAATNGSMACCQFVRVNDVIKHAATDVGSEYWIANCALTIDDGKVNIVKVKDNYAAAMLPNKTVSCAGPLLVWKGVIQSYPEESSVLWLYDTNPRTAIGLSKDGKTVVQVAVDGRWNYKASSGKRAIGLPISKLAQLMKALGCYKAMNFDGGGGTAMWVFGKGDSRYIVNHPHNEPYTYSPADLRATGSAVYISSDLK